VRRSYGAATPPALRFDFPTSTGRGSVFTVVFEVHPAPGKKEEYLALAKYLKPILEAVDGFIDNERFESKRREGWVLSLSTWRDEKAVVRWRSQGEHHSVQEQGRNGIFSDYHLRVCEVTADSHPPVGVKVIQQRFDATQTGAAKALAITEVSPKSDATFSAHPDLLPSHLGFDERAAAATEYDVFESITNPGKMLLLTSWESAEGCAGWLPIEFAGVSELRHRRVRNVRDYGLLDRREAAQYFPCPN
jgi:heme-degrading monooxygenase HmoA